MSNDRTICIVGLALGVLASACDSDSVSEPIEESSVQASPDPLTQLRDRTNDASTAEDRHELRREALAAAAASAGQSEQARADYEALRQAMFSDPAVLDDALRVLEQSAGSYDPREAAQ